MRSHMLNLYISPKSEEKQEQDDDIHIQPSQQTESASSSSSDEEEQDGEGGGEEKEVLYGLRENPKRSLKFEDPEFASVVLQDRESETESSKNPTRRRSKRTRKLLEHRFLDVKKLEFNGFSKMTESWGADPEQPMSSISETTTEEDVAFCLMMLSRDNKWKHKSSYKQKQKYEEETEESDEESKSCKIRSRGKYKCETCNRVFKSYQALGGHRASHKKLKLYSPRTELEAENAATSGSVPAKKIHECPYCFRVFSSGQALGGHKRSHVIGVTSNPNPTSTKIEDNLNLIDLNLPAPIDEDDASQIEVSAVSDAEFVNHIKR